MPRRVLVILAALQVVALPAQAAELIPSWDLEGRWSSNVLNAVEDEQSDFSIRTGPKVRVHEPKGDLVYDMFYQFLYEGFAQIEGLSDLSDADQFFSGVGTWRVTPTTKVTATDSFAYTTSLDQVFDNGALASTVTFGRERITTNNAQLSLIQDLSPRWQLQASVQNQLYHYQDPEQADTTATIGTVQVTRALTRKFIAGVGTQFQRQEFAEVDQTPSRGTNVYQAFGVVNYTFSPTFRLNARVGPAFVQPDGVEIDNSPVLSYYAVNPSTCPTRTDGTPVVIQPAQSVAELCAPAFYTFFGIPVAQVAPASTFTDVPFVGDQNVDSSLNYFGTLSITKEWRQWDLMLGYTRSASNSSGLNGSTILDQFSGTLIWNPSPNWAVTLDTIYSKQSALSEGRQRQIALRPVTETRTLQGLPVTTTFGVPFEVGLGDKLSSQIDLTTAYFGITASRRLSRQLTLIGSATYWQQQTGGLLTDTTLRDVEFSVGVTWTFDPIPL